MQRLSRGYGRRLGALLPQFIGLGLFAYFAFHLVQGERGVRAYAQLGKELEEAWAEEAALRSELEASRARVRALSAEALDPDLLEERAQAVLNFAHPDEVVVILPDDDAGASPFEAN